MANGQLNFGKQSGGVLTLAFPDGATNTDVVLPESGNIVSIDNSVTDNAVARYDGTTGKLQNSGVVIDDSGNVGIGTNSPSSSLTIKDGLTLINQLSNATSRPAITNGVQKYGVHSGINYEDNGFLRLSAGGGTNSSTKSYIDISGYSTVSDMNMNIVLGTVGVERARINTSGNVMIGTSTDNGVDKLQVNGNISYKTKSGRSVGTSLASVYITNTNSHTLTTTGANSPLMLEIVNPNSGVTCIPIYPFGGSGVKYTWNVLNPATGAFVNNINTVHLSLTVTDRGAYPNTYIITLNEGNSNISIQATTLNVWFYAYLTTM